MLSIDEKKRTGAEFELVYRVPVGEVPDAITVVLLLDGDFCPVSRGISICSPIEKSRHRDGYRRAKGRAIVALTEGSTRCRDNALIMPSLRIMEPDHPVHVAYKISSTKIDPMPRLTARELDMVVAFEERVTTKRHNGGNHTEGASV